MRDAEDSPLSDDAYRDLLAFRNELRRFLRWSEDRAREAGLTPALHQLMLVVRGHPNPDGPTIADAADALQMRHHSAVELAQRAEATGLLARNRDRVDQRRIHLQLTADGARALEALTREHLPRVQLLAQTLAHHLNHIDQPDSPACGPPRPEHTDRLDVRTAHHADRHERSPAAKRV